MEVALACADEGRLIQQRIRQPRQQCSDALLCQLHASRQFILFGVSKGQIGPQAGVLPTQRMRKTRQLVDFMGQQIEIGNHLATIEAQPNRRQPVPAGALGFAADTTVQAASAATDGHSCGYALCSQTQSITPASRHACRCGESTGAELNNLRHAVGNAGGNRRRFDETLRSGWRHAQRDKRPLSMLMCDIDHFKLYNDVNGHLAGDLSLKKVAAVITENLKRPTGPGHVPGQGSRARSRRDAALIRLQRFQSNGQKRPSVVISAVCTGIGPATACSARR